jgi:predicted molibdopterin-dependent oxidoreductase YjgC
LVEGGLARVSTEVGSAVLPVRVSPHVVEGTAFVPFNQPGVAVNALLSGWFTEAASLEAVGAPSDEDAVSAEEPEEVRA